MLISSAGPLTSNALLMADKVIVLGQAGQTTNGARLCPRQPCKTLVASQTQPHPTIQNPSQLFLRHVKRKRLFSLWEGNKMSNPRWVKAATCFKKKNREEGDLCEVRMTKADVIRLLEGFG